MSTGAIVLLSLTTPVLYGLLCAYAYYLAAWARITRFLWSRYPEGGWLQKWAFCPACSGLWYGAAIGALGAGVFRLPFLGLVPVRVAGWPYVPWPVVALVTAGCMGVVTALIARRHLEAMEYVGALHETPPATTAPPAPEAPTDAP